MVELYSFRASLLPGVTRYVRKAGWRSFIETIIGAQDESYFCLGVDGDSNGIELDYFGLGLLREGMPGRPEAGCACLDAQIGRHARVRQQGERQAAVEVTVSDGYTEFAGCSPTPAAKTAGRPSPARPSHRQSWMRKRRRPLKSRRGPACWTPTQACSLHYALCAMH
jgi:hypothetical protein